MLLSSCNAYIPCSRYCRYTSGIWDRQHKDDPVIEADAALGPLPPSNSADISRQATSELGAERRCPAGETPASGVLNPYLVISRSLDPVAGHLHRRRPELRASGPCSTAGSQAEAVVAIRPIPQLAPPCLAAPGSQPLSSHSVRALQPHDHSLSVLTAARRQGAAKASHVSHVPQDCGCRWRLAVNVSPCAA